MANPGYAPDIAAAALFEALHRSLDNLWSATQQAKHTNKKYLTAAQYRALLGASQMAFEAHQAVLRAHVGFERMEEAAKQACIRINVLEASVAEKVSKLTSLEARIAEKDSRLVSLAAELDRAEVMKSMLTARVKELSSGSHDIEKDDDELVEVPPPDNIIPPPTQPSHSIDIEGPMPVHVRWLTPSEGLWTKYALRDLDLAEFVARTTHSDVCEELKDIVINLNRLPPESIIASMLNDPTKWVSMKLPWLTPFALSADGERELAKLDDDIIAGRVTKVSIKLLHASAALDLRKSATFRATEACAAVARARGDGLGVVLLQVETLSVLLPRTLGLASLLSLLDPLPRLGVFSAVALQRRLARHVGKIAGFELLLGSATVNALACAPVTLTLMDTEISRIKSLEIEDLRQELATRTGLEDHELALDAPRDALVGRALAAAGLRAQPHSYALICSGLFDEDFRERIGAVDATIFDTTSAAAPRETKCGRMGVSHDTHVQQPPRHATMLEERLQEVLGADALRELRKKAAQYGENRNTASSLYAPAAQVASASRGQDPGFTSSDNHTVTAIQSDLGIEAPLGSLRIRDKPLALGPPPPAGAPLVTHASDAAPLPSIVVVADATKGHHAHIGDATMVKPTTRVFVGDLPLLATQSDLKARFAECGGIESVCIVTDHSTHKSRVYGFVTFTDLSGAAAAISLQGASYLGQRLRIEYARNRRLTQEVSTVSGDGGPVRGCHKLAT